MSGSDDQDFTRTSASSGGFRPGEGPRLPSGHVLADRYRIVSFLGRGGMGEVYRADDLTLGQAVALKFLPQELVGHPKLLERFRHEVRIGREITHPNVCRIYDIGEAEGRVFLSMEYVDGEDLASLLVRIERLPHGKAVQIARQLCAGLAAAHDRGILHRDLKPANVMLDGRGNVRITDFGIAALADSGAAESREGTPAYMAPEQLRGEPSTVRSDLYSLGLVLYELFTGKRAFAAETLPELIDLQTSTEPAEPSHLVSEMDPDVETLIMRCLDPDPGRRPESALSLAFALPGQGSLEDALAAGQLPSPQMVAESEQERRFRPWVTMLLVAGVLATAAGFFQITASRSIASLAPLDKPPAAMIDRAQEVIATLGIEGEPADRAWGYGSLAHYGEWLIEHEPAETRWDRVREARPAFSFFWYRQSPRPFNPPAEDFDRGIVTASDPRWSVPGEVYVSLDLAGRVRRIYVVPRGMHVEHGREPPAEPDFDPWFRLAGLDLTAFEPAEPALYPLFRADTRRAWIGVYPEDPSIPLRIEAGAADGRLSYFRFVPPWEDERDEEAETAATPLPTSATTDVLRQIRNFIARFEFLSFVLLVGLILASAVLTHRNLEAGRGDRLGAGRVAIFCGVLMLLAKWFAGERLVLDGQFAVLEVLAWGTFLGVGVWSAYIAIEPVVRRRWPRILVSWTRLTRGRFLDPYVGRSILTGLLLGGSFAFVHRASYQWASADDPWLPVLYRPISFGKIYHHADLFVLPSAAVIMSFLSVLILVGLRRLLKREWLAAVLFVPILALMNEQIASYWLSPLIVLAYSAILVVTLLRSGVLALIVAQWTGDLYYSAPLSVRITEWPAREMLVVAFVLAVVIAWGLVASLSRPERGRSTAT